MQTLKRAGTVIFVSTTSPDATVAQDIEAYGPEMQWASSIRAAVDLLNSTREKTVIVTQLALPDGNWRDLVEWVRCPEIPTPMVLVTSAITAELWWDALECGIDDICPGISLLLVCPSSYRSIGSMNGTNSSAKHYDTVVIGSSAPDITAPFKPPNSAKRLRW
jgi:CheY-like chemotaxis protein